MTSGSFDLEQASVLISFRASTHQRVTVLWKVCSFGLVYVGNVVVFMVVSASVLVTKVVPAGRLHTVVIHTHTVTVTHMLSLTHAFTLFTHSPVWCLKHTPGPRPCPGCGKRLSETFHQGWCPHCGLWQGLRAWGRCRQLQPPSLDCSAQEWACYVLSHFESSIRLSAAYGL